MKKIKSGARIVNLSAQMAIAWDVLDNILIKQGFDATVTCGSDGKHGTGSLHYIGYALDFRIWDMPKEYLKEVKTLFNEALGSDFDFVIESDHIHIEYQPK